MDSCLPIEERHHHGEFIVRSPVLGSIRGMSGLRHRQLYIGSVKFRTRNILIPCSRFPFFSLFPQRCDGGTMSSYKLDPGRYQHSVMQYNKVQIRGMIYKSARNRKHQVIVRMTLGPQIETNPC